MQINTLPSTFIIFDESTNWDIMSPKYVVVSGTTFSGDAFEVELDTDDLSRIDQNLPLVINAFHKWNSMSLEVSGCAIKSTLAVMRSEAVTLNSRYRQEQTLVEINSIELMDLGMTVAINGRVVDTEEIDVNGTLVPIACSYGLSTLDFDTYELDAIAPGWLQRFNVGKELGLTGVEFVHYVLPLTPKNTSNTKLSLADIDLT